MEAKEAVAKVEESEAFRQWKQQHPRSFLYTYFVMLGDGKITEKLVMYYDEAAQKASAFDPEQPEQAKEEEVLQSGDKVQQLDLGKVKVGVQDAVEKAAAVCREEYGVRQAEKTIAILQHLKEGQLWNITLLTQNYKTINVRIDAALGEVLSRNLFSLFEFSGKSGQ